MALALCSRVKRGISMSDMLAVLLGARGEVATQAVSALAGAKSVGKKASASASDSDPFMAVLFSRMDAAQAVTASDAKGGAVQAAASGVDPEVVSPSSHPSLPHAQKPSRPDASDAASLVAQTAMPATHAAASDAQGDADKAAADAGAVVAVLAMTVDPSPVHAAVQGGQDGGRPRVSTRGAATPVQLGNAARSSPGAAGTAVDRQLLPSSRHSVDPSLLQSKVDPTKGDLTPTNMSAGDAPLPVSAVQNLAVQIQPGGLDALSQATVQGSQLGTGTNMHGLGDVQARVAATPVQLSIDVPVRSPMFPQELGDRVVWLASRNGQVADISLNPPHLGPLEVKLSLSGGEAGAQFFSPHPQVRDAIEAALPRLREMMAAAGVTLGQTQVRDEAFPRQEAFQQGQAQSGVVRLDSGEQPLTGILGGAVTRSVGLGLVDLYV
jgi:flagellar hook-length control protein FliK